MYAADADAVVISIVVVVVSCFEVKWWSNVSFWCLYTVLPTEVISIYDNWKPVLNQFKPVQSGSHMVASAFPGRCARWWLSNSFLTGVQWCLTTLGKALPWRPQPVSYFPGVKTAVISYYGRIDWTQKMQEQVAWRTWIGLENVGAEIAGELTKHRKCSSRRMAYMNRAGKVGSRITGELTKHRKC